MKCAMSVPRISAISGMIAIVLAGFAGSQAIAQAHSFSPETDITLHSQLVSIHYHRQSGTMDIAWQDGHKLLGVTSGAHLEDGRLLSTAAYAGHDLVPSKVLATSSAAA